MIIDFHMKIVFFFIYKNSLIAFHFHLILIDLESPRLRASICIWNKFGAFSLFLLVCFIEKFRSSPEDWEVSKLLEESIFFSIVWRIFFFFYKSSLISFRAFSFCESSSLKEVREWFKLFIPLALVFLSLLVELQACVR